MKNYKLYIKTLLVLTLTFNFYSCEDYLKEEPKDLLVETNAFQTEKDAVAALAGIYRRFERDQNCGAFCGEIYSGYPAYRLLEITSHHILDGFGNSIYDRHAYNSGDGYLNQMWAGFYAIISRANFLLEKVADMNIDSKEEIAAEAKFLRAYAYFMLVNMFGDVPLRTETVKSGDVDVVQLSATSAQEIYTNVIIPDLKEGASVLPSWRNEKENKFRVTSIAAQAMLARVYLYMEDFELAMEAADKAINDGIAAGYGLFDNYMQTWGASYEGGKEHLFWLNYDWLVNSDLLHRRIDPSGNPITRVNGWGNNKYVEPNFYNNWPDDFRKQSAAPKGAYDADGNWIEFSTGQAYGAKHWDPLTNNGWGGNNKNLLRFAELYLIYAESANEVTGGPTPKAIEAINTIRQRARNFYELSYTGDGALIEANREIAGLEDIDPNNPPSQAEFRDIVYQEKDWELFQEYHSHLENVRRHKLAMKEKIDSKYLLENILSDFGTSVDNDIHFQFPKPLRELQLNPLLQQNVGY